MSDTELSRIIAGVIARAPALLRADLSSKTAMTRTAAEETLARMIAAAIDELRQNKRSQATEIPPNTR